MTDEEYYKIIHNLNVRGFTKLMSDYQVEVMKTLVTISEVHNVDSIEVMKTFGRCLIDSAERIENTLMDYLQMVKIIRLFTLYSVM